MVKNFVSHSWSSVQHQLSTCAVVKYDFFRTLQILNILWILLEYWGDLPKGWELLISHSCQALIRALLRSQMGLGRGGWRKIPQRWTSISSKPVLKKRVGIRAALRRAMVALHVLSWRWLRWKRVRRCRLWTPLWRWLPQNIMPDTMCRTRQGNMLITWWHG